MEKTLAIIKGARSFVLNLIKDLSIEEMNVKPGGFNNNLIWNLGHMIATQQIFCYRNSGLTLVVEPSLILKYATGTKPESFLDSAEFKTLEGYFLSTIDRFEEDARMGLFTGYTPLNLKPYQDLPIQNVEDALRFVAFHDGLHLGYMLALKRVLNIARIKP